ncbi:histone H1.1, embryonic-like [Asterias rubens]|uniref:histone H1.1, embryonic-like n=1 Tax=Asterias rubens TaxID=7604 RepID=UPI001455088D|nr:histone H1.1, embryonic-like [Asterias rubens]
MATEKKCAPVRTANERVRVWDHPPAMKMVVAAIVALKEKNGSSSQAIRKYIKDTFQVDMDRQAVFIRKALNTGVQQGVLIQTKGTGASGSFKLDPAMDKTKEKAKKVKQRDKVKKKKKEQAKKAKLKAQKAKSIQCTFVFDVKKEKTKKANNNKKEVSKENRQEDTHQESCSQERAAKPAKKDTKPSKAAKSPKPKAKKVTESMQQSRSTTNKPKK